MIRHVLQNSFKIYYKVKIKVIWMKKTIVHVFWNGFWPNKHIIWTKTYTSVKDNTSHHFFWEKLKPPPSFCMTISHCLLNSWVKNSLTIQQTLWHVLYVPLTRCWTCSSTGSLQVPSCVTYKLCSTLVHCPLTGIQHLPKTEIWQHSTIWRSATSKQFISYSEEVKNWF